MLITPEKLEEIQNEVEKIFDEMNFKGTVKGWLTGEEPNSLVLQFDLMDEQ